MMRWALVMMMVMGWCGDDEWCGVCGSDGDDDVEDDDEDDDDDVGGDDED